MTGAAPLPRSIPPKAEKPASTVARAGLDNRGLTQPGSPPAKPRRSSVVPPAGSSPATRRWALLDQLRTVTTRKSHRLCGRYTLDGPAEVGLRPNENGPRASVSNVVMCGSALCPVCNARRRAAQLQALDQSTAQLTGDVLLMTLTVPHDQNTRLDDMLNAMAKAWNVAMSGRQRKRWEEVGLVGWFRALDYTHGRNGHHPHYHVVLYFEGQLDGYHWQWAETRDRWERSIERSLGRRPSRQAQDIQTARDKGAVRDYAVKAMAMDALWSESKTEGGATMWDILARTDLTRNVGIWREIEEATYRRRWATAGGCVSLTLPEVDPDDTDTDTDDADHGEEVEPVLSVPRSVWSWLVASRLVPRLLAAVELRDQDRSPLDRWRAFLVVATADDDRARWRSWVPPSPE